MNKKVKRNDPCPCGSGKKYKACCWKKEQESRTTKRMTERSVKALQGGLSNMMTSIGEINKKLKDHKGELPKKIPPSETND